MKRPTTFFLKIAVFLIGIPILALCIFWLPWLAKETAELEPKLTYLQYPVIVGMYVAAVPFFFALYQALKILSYIHKNKAFSELSIKAIKYIKYCAIAISILIAACLTPLYLMADAYDAPGILALGLVITFASIVIAVFATVLQKLLKDTLDIKLENDLTV